MLAQHSSGSSEWHTPQKFVKAAKDVMGLIDLDPASCATANEKINAGSYYTEAKNGLSLEWYGSVFLNPPGGRRPGIPSLTKAFWQKLARSYVDQAIFLAFSMEALQTCQPSIRYYPMCIPNRRISFIDKTGQPVRGNTHASAFVYVHKRLDNTDRFAEVFRQFGSIYLPA